jgi:hypothetical protein
MNFWLQVFFCFGGIIICFGVIGGLVALAVKYDIGKDALLMAIALLFIAVILLVRKFI